MSSSILLIVSLSLMLLYTDSWWAVSSILLSPVRTLFMLFIWLVNSCLLLAPLIMLQFFVSFGTSRERFFMVFTSQHSLPLSCVPMLMQTGLEIPLIIVLPLVTSSYWVPLLSLGVARNNPLLLVPILKLSTMLSPMPPRNSSSFVGSWLTWVLLRLPVLLFTLLIMMFFMSAPSTLRSIVTSFIIIFSRVLLTYYLSPLRTSLLMYSPSPIRWGAYAILYPNSRWLLLHHLVFEGGC